MELSLLLTAISSSAIFLIISLTLIKEIKTKSFNRKEMPLVFLALIYLIFTIIIILWVLNLLAFNQSDLLAILSIILIMQTICLLTIFGEIRESKKIFYLLIPYLFLIPLIIFSTSPIHLAIPISLFIVLLAFLNETTTHERATRYLILYVSISLFIYTFTIFFQNLTQTLVLISTVLFLAFISPFLKFLRIQVRRKFPTRKKAESHLTCFLKHFIFIIIITNFIFIGTVSIHEFGHLITSSPDCEETKIIYELEGLPHTQISCEDTSQKNKWILGGVLLPLIVAVFLFFSGGKFIKELALQIIGFNLIISYLDLKSLNLSETIATFSLITGIILTVFSIALLSRSRVNS